VQLLEHVAEPVDRVERLEATLDADDQADVDPVQRAEQRGVRRRRRDRALGAEDPVDGLRGLPQDRLVDARVEVMPVRACASSSVGAR
jgi:hypothetical protein